MSAWVHRGLLISLLVSIFRSGKKASRGGGMEEGWGRDGWGLKEREGMTVAECVGSGFPVIACQQEEPT